MRRFVGTSLLAVSAVPFQCAMGLEKFDSSAIARFRLSATYFVSERPRHPVGCLRSGPIEELASSLGRRNILGCEAHWISSSGECGGTIQEGDRWFTFLDLQQN